MKKFKPGILLTAITTLFAFMSVLYISACNNKAPDLSPTSCENYVCQHGVTCKLGSCTCPAGYEGTFCETNWNAKFAGGWNVFEYVSSTDNFDSAGQQRSYRLTIDTGSTPMSMYLNNLRGGGSYFSHIASYVDSTKITFHIASFSPLNNGNYTIEGGSGYLYNHNGRDTVYGTYYTNYLNAQSAKQHDTITFLLTR